MARSTVSPPTPESNTPIGRLSGNVLSPCSLRARSRAIMTERITQSNVYDLTEHAERIGSWSNPCIGIEVPIYRQLGYYITIFSRQVQHFDVESKPNQRLLSKDIAGSRS